MTIRGAAVLAISLTALAGCAAVAKLPGAVARTASDVYHPASATTRVAEESAAAQAKASEAPGLDAPRSKALYLNLIRQLRMGGKPYAAIAHLDEFDKRYGLDDEAGVLRADCLVDIGNYPEADVVYRKFTHGPAAAKAFRGLGRSAGKQEHWPAAVVAFGEAVRREPTVSDGLSDLGYALLKVGNVNDAVFRLREAHELAPDDATITNNLVLALSASGGQTEAKVLVEKMPPADKAHMTALLAEQTAKPPAVQP